MSPISFINEKTLRRIRINQITRNPHQPRKYFDSDAIAQLSESIRQYGVLNPLTVRRSGGCYELIAGERRLRAAKAAGLLEVPCIVMNADEQDSSAIALVENLQRRDLDFFEEAQGYRQLIELYGLTQEEAARKVGKTQSAVANKLRLLKLSPKNMELIRAANLTERHARAVLRLSDEADRLTVTQYIIDHDLNVGRTEQYIDAFLKEKQQPPAPTGGGRMVRLLKDVRFFLNTVDKAVGLMKSSGVNATVEREEKDENLIVRILIPNCKKSG
jgi:ParB family chromosome partitioning protein